MKTTLIATSILVAALNLYWALRINSFNKFIGPDIEVKKKRAEAKTLEKYSRLSQLFISIAYLFYILETMK